MKKRLLAGLLATMMMSLMITTAFAEEPMDQPDSSIVEQYLLDAGYSMDFIEAIDDTIKLRLYEGQYVHQSTGTTYGVFTEDYQVVYTVGDDGEVIIDDENLHVFKQLLNDESTVEKIIDSQEQSLLNTGKRNKEPTLDVRAVSEMSDDGALRALSNWTGSCVVSHKSYSGGVVKKELTYTWKWRYSPVWTLTDKVAVAWSGGFTADEASIFWTYRQNVSYVGSGVSANVATASGYGYDDYDPNAGCAAGIDIKGSLPGEILNYHAGALTVTLTKATTEKTAESAIGRYYHVKIIPGISLGFSKSGPSISVTSGVDYDQSSDSAASFWSTTSGKP